MQLGCFTCLSGQRHVHVIHYKQAAVLPKQQPHSLGLYKLVNQLNVDRSKPLLAQIHLHVVFCSLSSAASFPAVLFGQFVVFQTLTSDVVEIYDGSSTDSALLSSIYGSHSGNSITL